MSGPVQARALRSSALLEDHMGTQSGDRMDRPKSDQDNRVKRFGVTYDIISVGLRRKTFRVCESAGIAITPSIPPVAANIAVNHLPGRLRKR